ncbi:MAG TPA: right-handed parallel beta-helix repeat-containing protein [Pyrinomonadaceae bacterium]|nr:right-handed parallel beta-helix repeat-containing protein [Pyrinomonadaceae bacterium]
MSRTKTFLLSLLSLFLLAGVACAQTRQRQTGVVQNQAGSARTVEANGFPGSDLGAKIDAADRSLGSAPGEIVARGGGRISTQVVVSGGHTLRLMAGTYATATAEIPILLKSGATVTGAGQDQTVILESPAKNQFTIIAAYNSARRNGDEDSSIVVSNLQLRGANPEFNSAQQAVSLGNCTDCAVDGVWVNGTRSIGIQLGGSADLGHWAENSRVTNCRFTHVASQNLALVNGRNITFENNKFYTPGQPGGPGSTVIDIEPNAANDRIQNVVIRNNLIDASEADYQAGNGILVQSGSGTPNVGPILIEGNTVIGGRNEGVVTNVISNGIYAFGATMRDVTISNNKVTRTGQCGLRIEGTRFTVTNNQFTNVGGGGLPGFYVAVTDSRIEGNSFRSTGVGPADNSVKVVGPFRNNVVRNNPGVGFPAGIQ